MKVRWFSSAILLIFVGVALIAGGCSKSTESSRGIVKFSDGEPVQSGSVELRSLANKERYASRIASNGEFNLTDKNGVQRCPPGDYEAVVVQIVWTEDLAAEDHTHGRTVPRRYADYYTSGLRLTKAADETPLMITLEPDKR